ncbi:14953_t:CDS:2 [Cetraspora pellucida]|uniref:14953_t:CDS:1 n=1 Tax=Cetraspora pellucida TaxID=1433469 RepID=A0A9N9NU31_9GLOM|nr:14953_t:CDS:2 [Cetraspora pellucida]
MLFPTNNKKKSKQAYKAKAHKHNINVNNSKAENSDNFFYNEVVENNNAASIVKRLQAAANNYYSNNNTAKEDIKVELSDNRWLDKVDEDNTRGLSEDEIETSNWYKKIQTILKNITLDIKNKNVNSEVWVYFNSICFYLQLTKYNYWKIEASKIVANVTEKGVYMLDIFILGHMIMLQINEVILPGLRFAPPIISLNTAKNYLKELSYVYKRLEHRMPVFSDKDMEVETWPDSSIQLLIFVIHNKCIFLAYDKTQSLWISEEKQPFKKKGEGCSIHVSEFLTDVHR